MSKLANKENPYSDGAFSTVEFTIGAEAANSINVAGQLKDTNVNFEGRAVLDVYLSTDAEGDNLAATAPDGDVAIGTNGVILAELVTDKYFKIITNADGQFDLDIGESGALSLYLIVALPSGQIVASTIIEFAA